MLVYYLGLLLTIVWLGRAVAVIVYVRRTRVVKFKGRISEAFRANMAGGNEAELKSIDERRTTKSEWKKSTKLTPAEIHNTSH